MPTHKTAARHPGNVPARWAAALCVVAFPLASAWWAADPSTGLRAIVLAAVIVVGLIATGGRFRLPRQVWWAAIVFLVAFTVSALISPTPLLSVLGRYPRYEGLPWLLACLAVAGLAGAMASRRQLLPTSLPAALSTVSAIVALGAVIDTAVAPDTRIVTPLGNASDAAGLAVVCLAGGLVLSTGWRRWICVTTAVLTIGLAASRGALLAALVVLVVAGAWAVLRDRTLRAGGAWAIGGVLTVGAFVAPMTRSRVLGQSPMSASTVTGRLSLWRDAVELWLSRPFLGAGPSRFVDDVTTVQRMAPAEGSLPADAPHNAVLQVLASTGALGLIAALALAATILLAWWPRRNERIVQAAALASLGVATVLMTHVSTPSYLLPVVFLVGLSLGTAASGADAKGFPARVTAFMLAAALLAAGSVVLASESALGAAAAKAARLESGADDAVLAATHLTSDPDFHRRAGYVLTGLAARGAADPAAAVVLLEATCPRLPNSAECRTTLEEALQLAAA